MSLKQPWSIQVALGAHLGLLGHPNAFGGPSWEAPSFLGGLLGGSWGLLGALGGPKSRNIGVRSVI